MKRLLAVLLLCLTLPLQSSGQTVEGWWSRSTGDASGACIVGRDTYWANTTSGAFFWCNAGTWAVLPSSSGAPTTATYLTQTADGGLSAEQAMGLLTTGIVINTTTTGVQSIYGGAACTNQVIEDLSASGASTCTTITSAFTSGTFAPNAHNLLSASHGDTLSASPVLGDVLFGNVTPAWARLAGNITTTKQYLSQTGTGAASAAPVWAQPAFADLSGTATDAQLASSYSGVGACTNQFARTLNDNAAPTCATVTRSDVSASIITEQWTFTLYDPNGLAATDDIPSIIGNRARAITITEVWCESNDGTAVINLQRDDGTPADILSANLTCGTGGSTGTIAAAEDNVATGQQIDFVFISETAVTRVNIVITYTID